MELDWQTGLLLVDIFISCLNAEDSVDYVKYLQQFHYMDADSTGDASYDESYMKYAIQQFQRIHGLAETGDLDPPTRRLMNKTRCGNGDGDYNLKRRRRRNAKYYIPPNAGKWNKTELTYRISKYSENTELTQAEIDRDIYRAFKKWSDVVDVKFRRDHISLHVDIEIYFGKGHHGCEQPFLSKKVNAHGFYPNYGGDIHFNDDVFWHARTTREEIGTSLFVIAAHEVGHSLGLGHFGYTTMFTSLMRPMFPKFFASVNEDGLPDYTLSSSDVEAIKILYAMKRNETRTDSMVKKPTLFFRRKTYDNPCINGKIDAIAATPDQKTYAFRGKYLYVLGEKMFQKAALVKSLFRGVSLTDVITAAIGDYNGLTYLFTDYLVYVYENYALKRLARIQKVFPSFPNKIDAAFVLGVNGELYAFKGDKYWKHNGGDKYPLSIESWSGVPPGVDAVLSWNTAHHSYFFKDLFHYLFNNFERKVEEGYPKKNTEVWFNCAPKRDASREGSHASVMEQPSLCFSFVVTSVFQILLS